MTAGKKPQNESTGNDGALWSKVGSSLLSHRVEALVGKISIRVVVDGNDRFPLRSDGGVLQQPVGKPLDNADSGAGKWVLIPCQLLSKPFLESNAVVFEWAGAAFHPEMQQPGAGLKQQPEDKGLFVSGAKNMKAVFSLACRRTTGTFPVAHTSARAAGTSRLQCYFLLARVEN